MNNNLVIKKLNISEKEHSSLLIKLKDLPALDDGSDIYLSYINIVDGVARGKINLFHLKEENDIYVWRDNIRWYKENFTQNYE